MDIHSFFTYSYIICVRVLGYINAGSFSDCSPVCLVFYTYVMKLRRCLHVEKSSSRLFSVAKWGLQIKIKLLCGTQIATFCKVGVRFCFGEWVLSTWYLILCLPPLAATGAYSAQSHSFSFLLLSSDSIYVCIVMFLCWWVFTTAIKAWVSCRGDCTRTSIVSFWTESTKDLIRTALESILPAGAAAAVSVGAESSSIKSWPGHCPEGQSRVLILKLYDGDIY